MISATMAYAILCVLFFALSQFVAASSPSFERKCLDLQPEQFIIGARRNILQYIPAGTVLTFPDNDATCNRGTQAVSVNICRIALSVQTSEQSSIIVEAWLPEHWTGRFLATGNGGIDGCRCTNDSVRG
jgi:feruloyl esterase